ATDQLPSILPSNTAPVLSRFHPRGLLFRILFLAFLFASELLVISISLDGSSLVQARGLAGVIRDGGPSVLRALVGVCALFATFLWLKHRAALERFSLEWEEVPIARGLLCFHAVSMATFGWLSSRLYAPKLYQGATFPLGSSGVNVLAAGWILAGSAGIAFGALAFLPWKH